MFTVSNQLLKTYETLKVPKNVNITACHVDQSYHSVSLCIYICIQLLSTVSNLLFRTRFFWSKNCPFVIHLCSLWHRGIVVQGWFLDTTTT